MVTMSGSIIKTGSLITPGGATGSVGPSGRDSQEIGSIKAWPSLTAPPSWDLCDGGELGRTMYPDLFTLIGTNFGPGNGTTTFNKPDLRGRYIIGAGAGAGLTNRVLAAKGGEENHQLSVAEMPAHNHSVVDNGHVHTLNDPQHQHPTYDPTHNHGDPAHGHVVIGVQIQYQGLAVGQGGNAAWAIGGSTQVNWTTNNGTGIQAAGTGVVANWTTTRCTIASGTTGISVANSGGAGVHNNMPPFLVLVYIIKISSTGGPTAQAPIADTTQNGLLRKVSGKTTDFVDGTNNCQDLTGFVTSLLPVVPVIPPPADATQDGLLRKVSGLTSDYVDGTNHCKDFATAVRSVSTAVRSYNAIGNPNFEVDQRTCGTGVTAGGFAQDRWLVFKASGGTIGFSTIQTDEVVVIPGTSFPISCEFLRVKLTAQEVNLLASSSLGFLQYIEGPRLRELISGPHSISLLVRCSSPLKFSVALRDNGNTYTLSKLATIPTAGVWTIIPLPNIPIWTPNATFSTAPGTCGYHLLVTIAAGTNFIPASNDIWQTPALYGAIGQDNFAGLPVNSTFDVAFVQHEPGSICSGFIDLPFHHNYEECLRYYCKSQNYNQKVGAGGADCGIGNIVLASQGYIPTGVRFPRRMAKVPSVGIWNRGNTAQNALTTVGGVAVTVNGVGGISESGWGWITSTPAYANAWDWQIFHYVADTGW